MFKHQNWNQFRIFRHIYWYQIWTCSSSGIFIRRNRWSFCRIVQENPKQTTMTTTEKSSCEQQWASDGNVLPEENTQSSSSWHEGMRNSNPSMISGKASQHEQHIEAWGRLATAVEDTSVPFLLAKNTDKDELIESGIFKNRKIHIVHWDHTFPILMFDVKNNWSSWPVSVWGYSLSFGHVIDWLDNCINEKLHMCAF